MVNNDLGKKVNTSNLGKAAYMDISQNYYEFEENYASRLFTQKGANDFYNDMIERFNQKSNLIILSVGSTTVEAENLLDLNYNNQITVECTIPDGYIAIVGIGSSSRPDCILCGNPDSVYGSTGTKIFNIPYNTRASVKVTFVLTILCIHS